MFGKLIEGKRPLYLVWFLVGLCLGLLLKQRLPIRFKEELDLLPLLQMAATLVIALLITHYGRQRADERRAEKEIVIELLRESQTRAKGLYEAFYICCEAGQLTVEQKEKFTQGMRDLSNRITTIEKATPYLGEQPVLKRRLDHLRDAYIGFKTCITVFSSATDISNFKIRNDAESEWRKLDERLMAFIFETNRL